MDMELAKTSGNNNKSMNLSFGSRHSTMHNPSQVSVI